MLDNVKTIFLMRSRPARGFYNLHIASGNVIIGMTGPYPSRPIARLEATKLLSEQQNQDAA